MSWARPSYKVGPVGAEEEKGDVEDDVEEGVGPVRTSGAA